MKIFEMVREITTSDMTFSLTNILSSISILRPETVSFTGSKIWNTLSNDSKDATSLKFQRES